MRTTNRRGRQVAQQHYAERYADPGDVEKFAASLPDSYLACRDLTHSWRPFNATQQETGLWIRVLRCYVCKARKTQHLDSRGNVIGRSSPDYPDGYLAKGLGRIAGEGKGVLRLESLTRQAGKADRRAKRAR